MAETTNRATGKGVGPGSDAAVAARTAARKVTADKVAKLSDRNKWALTRLRAAKASISAAQDAMLDGKEPSVAFVSACGDVASRAGDMIFAD